MHISLKKVHALIVISDSAEREGESLWESVKERESLCERESERVCEREAERERGRETERERKSIILEF